MNGLTRSARSFLRGLLVLVASVGGAVFSVSQATPDWIWQLHTNEGGSSSLAYEPGGEHLLAAGGSQVRRWNLATGQIVRRYRTSNTITDVVVSEDGTLVAALDQSKYLIVWNIESGVQLCKVQLGAYGMGVRFLPGQHNLLVATYTNPHLHEVDPHTGLFVRSDPLTENVWEMDTSAAGGVIAIAGSNNGNSGYVRVFDLATRSIQWSRVMSPYPSSVSLSPDGSKVAVGSSDFKVRVYATENLVLLATLDSALTGEPIPRFSDDGDVLFTLRRPVYGYRTSDWQRIHDFYPDSPPNALAFHPAGGTVALTHSDAIRLYSRVDMTETGRFAPSKGRVTRWVSRPDDSQYATAHENGHRFYAPANLWQSNTGEWLSGFNYNIESSQSLYAIDYSSDGARLAVPYASASLGRVVRVFDVTSGALYLEFPSAHTSSVNDLRYSPNGLLIATASSDKLAKVWNAQTGALVATLTGHTASVSLCFFRGNNELITVSNSGREVARWDITTGQPIQTWTFTETIRAIYVASTDRLFVNVGYGMTCQEISVATGNLVNTIAFPGWLAAVSRDGTTLLSSGAYMDFLNASTGATLASLDNSAPGMEFTNDGSRVFTREGVIDNPVQSEFSPLTAWVVAPAQILSGSAQSLLKRSDNQELRAIVMPMSNGSRTTQLVGEVSTVMGSSTPRAITVRMTSKANTVGQWLLTLQLYDWVSGSWSSVATTESAIGVAWTDLLLTIRNDTSRYIAADGAVRMRYTVRGVLGRQPRLDHSIDYVRFDAVQ